MNKPPDYIAIAAQLAGHLMDAKADKSAGFSATANRAGPGFTVVSLHISVRDVETIIDALEYAAEQDLTPEKEPE